MRWRGAARVRFYIMAFGSAALLLFAWSWFHWYGAEKARPLHSYRLQAGRMDEWKSYGGTWEIGNGVMHNNSDERGAKLLAGSTDWKDYTLNADIKFDGEHGDMGVVIRSNNEEEGVDAYNGYYMGLRTTDGTLVIGRSDYGWMEALPVLMPGGVHAYTWYHLRVAAVGCNIAVSSQNMTTLETAWVAFNEHPCVVAGRIGLRSLSTGGMWRHIGVAPATYNDYLDLARHANGVEQPEFPKRETDYNHIFHFLPTEISAAPANSESAEPKVVRSHIGDLQDFSRTQEADVVVRGVVTLTSPNLYVEDASGGLLVRDSQIQPLNVGDVVEVSGYTRPTLYSAIISGGTVRVLGSGTPLPPVSVTPWQAASGTYDARFIEIEGRLTGTELTAGGNQILDFTEGGQSFRAIYTNRPDESFHKLKKNSYLRVRGVCVLNRKYTQELTPFVLLLRSDDDIDVLSGPPWWTPWHVGMLFAGVLVLVLLIQLVYFRIQQWNAYTITQERERLAHEIHDTMAQSFAGVGYQIQGIRSSVVRGDRQDFHHIADQLSVAYQLVRRCHEEASRTIAVLGSSSPHIQENLLGALAEKVRKIAGNQIKTITELRGNPTSLNLRLANALLHIGQEAIANAVSHSNPTVLTITLFYEESSVEMVVEDNGQGFEYTPETAGFGILGMQKRAHDIAGTLHILSTLGRGTQVRIKANLQRDSLRKRMLARLKKSSR